MKPKAVIIDGHNFLFRGFYGVPESAKRSDGTPINAVYGFFALLRNALDKLAPDYLIVVFDSETSSDHKKDERPEYKANRIKEDNSIYDQLTLIKKCLKILGIKWVEHEAHEADDLIGTYAKHLNDKDIHTCICSSDNDFMQLVCENISIAKGHHGNITVYNEDVVFEKFGIHPTQYLDYHSLVGDASDNIKGVKGIGKKRAVQLLNSHGEIEKIYTAIDTLPKSLQSILSGNKDFLTKQKEFLKIKADIVLANEFLLDDFSFSNKSLPQKMGSFLEENWNMLKYPYDSNKN